MKRFAGLVFIFTVVCSLLRAHTLTLGGKVGFNQDPAASGFSTGDTGFATYNTLSLASETHMPGFNQWNYLASLTLQFGPASWTNLPVMLSLTDMGFATVFSATLTPAPAPGSFSINHLGFLMGVGLENGFLRETISSSAFSTADLAMNFPSGGSTAVSVIKFSSASVRLQTKPVPDTASTLLLAGSCLGIVAFLRRRMLAA